jgi:hypothetical protein
MRQTKPIFCVFGLKMRAGEKTKPIGAARGRDWGLGIADWGFAGDARGASVDKKANKANLPLLATSRAVFGGAGRRDWGFEATGAAPVWTECETKPICRVFGLKTRVGLENKANLRGLRSFGYGARSRET